MADGVVAVIPSFGFARGAIVTFKAGDPNMLVVWGLEVTTVVVVCEGDDAGQLRLREYETCTLKQVLDKDEGSTNNG